MQLRLLGAIELQVDDKTIDLGPPQRVHIFAALAIDAGRALSAEALIDRIWGKNPPKKARRSLHAHLSHLRRTFTQTGIFEIQLLRKAGKYQLELDESCIDIYRFKSLAQQAMDPAHERKSALCDLRYALKLWNGDPLAGLRSEWAEYTRTRWREHYINAAIAWAEAETRAGQPERPIDLLSDLSNAHPLVEPLRAALMRTLVAAKRPAEALELYAETRRTLADELGTEPSTEITSIYLGILHSSQGRVTTPLRPISTPAQLPMNVRPFIGRDDALELLDIIYGDWKNKTHAAGLATVSGLPGVGKSSFAIYWSHRACREFPDGQLYIDFHGRDPKQQVTEMEALGSCLIALGVPSRDLAPKLADRSAQYRTELAGKRILILLDNAISVDHLHPILPGTSSCFVLITSRKPLNGLIAKYGARHVPLHPLELNEAYDFLERTVGNRIDSDPKATSEIVQLSGRLPLALGTIAELILNRPTVTLAELVSELKK